MFPLPPLPFGLPLAPPPPPPEPPLVPSTFSVPPFPPPADEIVVNPVPLIELATPSAPVPAGDPLPSTPPAPPSPIVTVIATPVLDVL